MMQTGFFFFFFLNLIYENIDNLFSIVSKQYKAKLHQASSSTHTASVASQNIHAVTVTLLQDYHIQQVSPF